MADVRAIAVCKGGPLDGQHFSVLLDEQGSPEPLESRAEVAGALYLPATGVPLSDGVAALFMEHISTDDDGTVVLGDAGGYGHEQAFEYVPHAFTVEHDENGAVTKMTAGAAL